MAGISRKLYYCWRPRVQASVNGGAYFDVYFRDYPNCENRIYDDYSEWNDRFATIGEVQEGDDVNTIESIHGLWKWNSYYLDTKTSNSTRCRLRIGMRVHDSMKVVMSLSRLVRLLLWTMFNLTMLLFSVLLNQQT